MATLAERLANLRSAKEALLNTVSAALIKEPSFDVADDASPSAAIKRLVEDIANTDAEFILKLAVYVRDDLGLRGTANLLTALCAYQPKAHPFLMAYLRKIIVLPSDWLQIATFARDMPGRTTSGLPTALRHALANIFVKFNEHSLAKYNKEGAQKAKAKRQAAAKAANGEEDDSDGDEPLPPYTLKQMIRMLHIPSPRYYVMCILGKRYPSTQAEFDELNLAADGRSFDPARVSQRMRLAVPTTWETQLAAKGNHAYVWDELVETKQLPFMAMLRNLRNIICAGCKPETHQTIIGRLTNEDQVAGSRQFPYRFFSAFDAIDIKWDEVFDGPRPGTAAAAGRGRATRPAPRKPAQPGGRPVKLKTWPATNIPTDQLLGEYKAALDKAVQIATALNIRPIHGRTVVAVHVSPGMFSQMRGAGAKGIGSVRQYVDVALLLALMFAYACEDVTVLLFCNGDVEELNVPRNGKILENLRDALAAATRMNREERRTTTFPFNALDKYVQSRQAVHALVVIDDTHTDYADKSELGNGSTGAVGVDMPFYLQRLRRSANPDMLYVAVNVAGNPSPGGSTPSTLFTHPNDVMITGFSDAILRFVAERGGGGPLAYVERIDEVKKIDTPARVAAAAAEMPVAEAESDADDAASEGESDSEAASALDAVESVPRGAVSTYRDCRFFVSSTFLDMQSERDALSLEVFPALRRRCIRHGIKANITEVDLRWGVTSEDAAHGLTLATCMNEVALCAPFYIGMIGARAGYRPKAYDCPPIEGSPIGAKHFEWLSEAPAGLSVTELEYRQAMESSRIKSLEQHRRRERTALMLVRDSAVTANTVPNSHKHLFTAESKDAQAAVKGFVRHVREHRDTTAMARYTAPFTAFNGKHVGLDMQDFKEQALRRLWAMVLDACGETAVDESDDACKKEAPLAAEAAAQANAMLQHTVTFAGRAQQLAAVQRFATGGGSSNVMLVLGAEGSGKSALVAQAAAKLSASVTDAVTLYHSCAVGDGSPFALGLRMAAAVVDAMAMQETVTLPTDADGLADVLPKVLKAAGRVARFVFIIDDVDSCSDPDQLLALLPSIVPSDSAHALRFVVAARSASPIASALRQRRPPCAALSLADLDVKERTKMLRRHLARLGKKLQESASRGNQLLPLARKAEAGKPTYLVQVLTYLRLFATFDSLERDIRYVGSTVVAVQNDTLARFEKRFGAAVCRSVLTALALSTPLGGMHETDVVRVAQPVAAVRQLLYALQAVIDWRAGVVLLTDNALHRAITKRYLKGREDALNVHRELVDLYLQPLQINSAPAAPRTAPLSVRDMQVASKAEATALPLERLGGRSLLSLMHHALHGKRFEHIETLMSSVQCLEAVIEGGLLPQLLTTIASLGHAQRLLYRKLEPFVSFVIEHRHILRNHPGLTLQCALNTAPKSPVHAAALVAARASAPSMVLWQNREGHGERDCTQTTVVTDRPLLCAAFDETGKHLALGGKDWACRIVNVYDGTTSRVLKHPNDVTAVALLKSTCVTGCEDGIVRVWNRSDGAVAATGNGHTRRITAVAVHPQGVYMLSSSDDGSVRKWQTGDGARLKQTFMLRRHGAPVSACAIHSGGKINASGGWEGRVHFWSNEKGTKPVWFNTKRKVAVRCVAFVPSMTVVAAVGSYDGGVDLFDFAGEVHQIALSTQHLGMPLTSVNFSADGKFMVTCDTAGAMKMWRAGVVGDVLATFNGHAAAATGGVFDPRSSRTIVSISSDATARHWLAPEDERQAALHASEVTCVVADPAGKFVVTASRDTKAFFFDLEDDGRVTVVIEHQAAVRAVCVDPATSIIIIADNDGRIYGWHPRPGIGGRNGSPAFEPQQPAPRPVASLACAAGSRVVVAYDNGEVRSLDANTGAEVKAPPPSMPKKGIASMALLTDNSVVLGTYYGGAMLLGLDDGNNKIYSAGEDWITAIAAHSASRSFVTGCYDGTVKAVIGSNPSRPIRCSLKLRDEFFSGDRGARINDLSFAGSAHTLLAACEDRTLRVLELDHDEAALRQTHIFFTTAPATAVAWCRGRVYVGDRLGNVYTATTTEASGVDGAKDAARDTSTLRGGTESGSAIADEWESDDDLESSFATTATDDELDARFATFDDFRIITEEVPPTLRGAERRAFFIKQRAVLKIAMKMQRRSEIARAAMRLYAQRSMQVFGAYQKLASAPVQTPIFAPRA